MLFMYVCVCVCVGVSAANYKVSNNNNKYRNKLAIFDQHKWIQWHKRPVFVANLTLR